MSCSSCDRERRDDPPPLPLPLPLRPLPPRLLSSVPSVDAVVAGLHSEEPLTPLTTIGCAAYARSRGCGMGCGLLPAPPFRPPPPPPKPALPTCC